MISGATFFLCCGLAMADEFNNRVKPILSQHCFTCHGPDAKQRKGDLRLDVPQGETGYSEERVRELFSSGRDGSEIFARITTSDPDDRMPPGDKPALKPEEIEILGAWLDGGAVYSKHWAFQAPAWPDVPAVEKAAWVRGPIDAFVLAQLESRDIAPSPEADPATLVRRVYLDLIGIPPTPEEVDVFVANPTDEAYAALVDGLLASPHFGERWGRHWLDQARYADSNGYSIDGPRQIWPYRDWVIAAINEDKPFDEFVVEQIAGDLLPGSTREQRVATGFNRNTMINQEGGIDKEEFRIEAVVDRVNTTGQVFLGLTLACAKCHDHKYDPVYHDEYYKLFAFYNDDDEVDLELPTAEQEGKLAEVKVAVAEIAKKRDDYRARALQEKLSPWLAGLTEEHIKDWGLKEKDAITRAPSEWTEEQRGLIEKRFLASDVEYQAFEKSIAELNATLPAIDRTMVLARRDEPRESRIFEAGDFTRKGEVVTPGVPAVLHPLKGDDRLDRLDLARWITDRGNPLTARVTVNRYWQALFGRGLVETENDFGYQGALPTHPELLDHLANTFIARGWSVKSMLREMVLSSTYRQVSHVRPDLEATDPRNNLLARQNRVRLDAEIIRDASLAAAAQLDRRIGGPSVFPPLPDGVMRLGQSDRSWETSEGPDRFRRGMYTYFWRATPHSSLVVFDAPDALVSCTRRTRSNTPLQALTLLNDRAYVEHAEGLAQRIAAVPAASDGERLDAAFRICLSRAPAPGEKAVLEALLGRARAEGRDPERAWFMVARTLLNLDEFITRE